MRTQRFTLSLLASLPLCAGMLASLSPVSHAQVREARAEIPQPGFLRAFAETGRFALGKPAGVSLLPDGQGALFMRSGPRSFVRDMYFVDSTGRERVFLTAQQLLGGTEERLTAEELARRERMRLSARGIADFSVSRDGETLLVPLSGRLFLVDRASSRATELPGEGGAAIAPALSRDASLVGVVRDGDLYVIDVPSGVQHRITDRRREPSTVSFGAAEFVAQEEMRRREGFWIAPDNSSIVYQRTDVEGLEIFTIADPADPAKPATTWPYPRAGTKNAEVRLFAQKLDQGRPLGPVAELRWDRDAYPYLARVVWSKGAPLTILVQNRLQTEQKLYAVNERTGALTELVTERDDAWVDIDAQMPRWINEGQAFLWTTKRNGSEQLELRDRSGRLVRALTDATPGYRSVAHVDEKAFDRRGAVYIHHSDDPTQQHVVRVPLSAEDGSPVRLTSEPGVHSLSVAHDGSTAVLHSRPLVGNERWEMIDLRQANAAAPFASPFAQLQSKAEDPGFRPSLEFVRTGPRRDIDAVVIRPRDFDATKRYPVIVNVYAGPTSVMVERVRDRYIFQQWVADHGFIVVAMDGRGTPRRGNAWQHALKFDFISKPLEDQVAGLRTLGDRFREMDLSRVGVYGWSYGGYFAAMAVMQRPDVFHVGVAGAPVADWIDYDTHYTERYAGLPQDTPEAYRVSNVLTYADRLERPLLIIHGTADDNVYFVHALKMADSLFKAGKQFDFIPLSNQTHMVTRPDFVEPMWARVLAYFQQHLGGPVSPE